MVSKLNIMVKIVFIIFFLATILNCVSGFKFASTLPPKIGISGWMTIENSRSGKSEWEHGWLTPLLVSGAISVERNANGTTIIIAPHLDKIRIVCNASYPVRWYSPQSEFRPDDMYSYLFYVYETRYTKNVRDPRSFIYQSTLEIELSTNGVSRKFVCQSMVEPTIQRNLYIYWEGSMFLTYAGEVIDVRTMDNKTLILPCTVNRPDANVYLVKETEQGDRELQRNASIQYSSNIGFTLMMDGLENPYGRYRCISEDEEESVENDEKSVRLNVLHGIHQNFYRKNGLSFNQTIRNNATFTYDEDSGNFICCSSSAKPPNLRVIYCQDQVSCKTKTTLLYKISNSHSKWSVNGSCSRYEVYRRNSGILRCRGDDIDVFKMYFTSMINPFAEVDTIKVYYTLEDVPKEELLNVIPSDLFMPIYSGQNFSAYCDASDFYFSRGIQWAIKWKNNSLQFLEESTNPYYEEKYRYGRGADFSAVLVTAYPDMVSLICYAPVWNSTDWVKKETPLVIKEPILPVVFMEPEDVFHWNLNATNKLIECIATGDPVPYIHWRKDNKSILLSETNFDVIQEYENGSSIINISRVSHDTQGEYICTGVNFAGEDQKHVKVFVVETPVISSSFLIILISMAVCLFLLAGIFFLIWKLKLQKNIIDHLAGVVFRDVK